MDPTRRLQVLNQSNPSLRVATAPTPRVTVETAHPGTLSIGDIHVNNTTSTQPYVPPAPKRSFISSAADAIASPFKPFGQGLTELITHGTGLGTEGLLNKQKASDLVDEQNAKMFTDLYHQGKLSREAYGRAMAGYSGDQLATNTIARDAQVTADKSRLVGSAIQTASAPFVGAAEGISAVIPRVAARFGEGAVLGGLNELSSQKDPTLKGTTTQGAIGGVTGVILPGVLNKAGSLIKKGVNAIRGGDAAIADKLVSKLAGATTDTVVKKQINKVIKGVDPSLLDTTAKYIAKEDNPETIRALLDTLKTPTENAAEPIAKNAVDAAIETKKPTSVAKGETYTTASGVKSKVDEALVKEGLITGKIGEAKIGDLTLGADTEGPIDPAQIAKYVDELSHGKPIEPVIVERGANGELLVQDGKHRLEAMKALGIEDVPITEKASPVTASEKATQAVQELPQQNGTADVSTLATSPATDVTGNPGELGNTVNTTADTAAKASTDAKIAFPDADPESQKAIQEVMDQLGNAEAGYNTAAKARTIEKGQRVGAGAGAFESAGGGEAGMRAKLSQLQGKYSESGFNPIHVSPETQTAILNSIENSNLREFEKLNTQQAIRKIWGTTEGKPTPGDINNIRKFFGDGVAQAVQDAVQAGGTTWREKLAVAAATPKAAMATADLSAPLRQGGVLGTRFPKEFAKNAAESVKFFGSQQAFDDAMTEIAARPNYELMKKAKLAVDGAEGIVGTEEQFMSSLLESDVAKKLVVGKITAASDRGYTGFLTKFRADVFDKIINETKGAGIELGDKELADLGKFINSASGRGDLGQLEKHSGLLSKALFSPRLWKSRLDLLNPAYYAKLSGPAQKYALQSSASFAATAGTILSLASLAGATVIWDPRSADFAKIKVGNTRYDILGGLQQNIRLGAQLVSGQKINSETGQLQTLGPNRGFGKPSRKDILVQFFENKENPLLGYATKLLEGSDAAGNPINPVTEGGKLLVPLNIAGAYETAQDTGSLPKGIAMNLPGTFGVGVQTYGKTATKDAGKPATNLTDQITADTAAGKTNVDDFKKSLSKDDQAILGASTAERQSLLDSGKITQDQFDQAKSYDQVIKNMKGENKPPKGANSDQAKEFFKKYTSLTTEGQKAWLAAKPDANATSIATEINKVRSKGLSEYKPSNELTKAYSEYEKDINSHPEYSVVDKRNKAKAFQAFASKLNYTSPQRDIFAEGGSTDMRALIDAKSIDKADLDAAIQLDNELYTSGVTGSLKFSKKFREDFGYDVPSGEGGPNAGKGGSSKTKSAHLSSLLPNASSDPNPASVPKFSSRSRNPTFTSPVKLGSGSSKRVSIKL